PLPALAVQYADFVHWQRRRLSGAVLDEELGYWRRQLQGLPPLLELPYDRPRPAVQSYTRGHPVLAPPPEVAQGLPAVSPGEGSTLFMTLRAAFQSLLARYTGRDDIAVGVPIAGRNLLQTEDLIGFFVNTLVLRVDLAGNPSSRQVLRRVWEVVLAAHVYQD